MTVQWRISSRTSCRITAWMQTLLSKSLTNHRGASCHGAGKCQLSRRAYRWSVATTFHPSSVARACIRRCESRRNSRCSGARNVGSHALRRRNHWALTQGIQPVWAGCSEPARAGQAPTLGYFLGLVRSTLLLGCDGIDKKLGKLKRPPIAGRLHDPRMHPCGPRSPLAQVLEALRLCDRGALTLACVHLMPVCTFCGTQPSLPAMDSTAAQRLPDFLGGSALSSWSLREIRGGSRERMVPVGSTRAATPSHVGWSPASEK
jgi:hypothetical protein